MGILSRLNEVVRANLNELLDRAEDPVKLLEQQLLDMEDAVRDAKRQTIAVAGDERKLEIQLRNHEVEAAKWAKRAEAAMRHGDETLAREALIEKVSEEKNVERLRALLEKQREYGDSLRTSVRALEEKLRDARAKKIEVVARHKVGQAVRERDSERAAATPVTRADTGDPAVDKHLGDFARMEDKVNTLDAEWEAMNELSRDTASDSRRREVEAKFQRYEAETGVDDALADLRKKLDK
ncbi:MAG: PspA/IM30 family protein [Deltaproteobacteria bacterium]|nr:PspA/IM30 family protein [Deltaproteobacteria bacterium]